jgi:DNA polymerase-3 subunit gamma/tau
MPSRHRETQNRQAAVLTLDTILAGLDILSTTKARLRASSHGRVLVEMALVRLGRLDDLASLAQLTQWLRGAQERGTPSAERPEEGSRRPALGAPRSPSLAAPPETAKKKPETTAEGAVVKALSGLSPDSVPQVWEQVINQVGPMLASVLKKAQLPAIFGPNTLVLRFPSSYNSEREHCQQPANVARVEEVLRRITAHGWNVRIESTGGDGESAKKAPDDTENPQSRYRRQRVEAMNEPLVRRAMEVLGAQLVDVDEGFGLAPGTPPDRGDEPDSEEHEA